MPNYRDYFLSAPRKEAPMACYRITLSVEQTGEAFMYHNTERYNEAAKLVKRYSAMDGIKVAVEKVSHA